LTAGASRPTPAPGRDILSGEAGVVGAVGNAGVVAVSKADAARKIAERSLNELSEQIEAGNSDRLDAFLRAMGRFHSYSFNNIMLILSQRPEATRVAGFRAWKGHGRSVKKGEKGIMIFAPMRIKPKEGEMNRLRGDGDVDGLLLFRVVHVFDLSQTEGEPLPEPASVGGDPGENLDRLESVVRSSGIVLENSAELGSADGVSKGGVILLRKGLCAAERFSVLAHEWAHELLHKVGSDERPSKVVRETEAEAVAFVVSQAIGLETGSASSDYILTYDGDKKTLASSLERVQKTACRMIEAIEEPIAQDARSVPDTVRSIAFSRQKGR